MYCMDRTIVKKQDVKILYFACYKFVTMVYNMCARHTVNQLTPSYSAWPCVSRPMPRSRAAIFCRSIQLPILDNVA